MIIIVWLNKDRVDEIIIEVHTVDLNNWNETKEKKEREKTVV